MKSLVTLIKLQKTRVDEQQTVLSRLLARVEGIERQIAELEIAKAREQGAAEQSTAEARATYGSFLKEAVRRGRELENERKAVLKAVEDARAVLAELFQEQKRYEIAQSNREDAEAKEERRRETIDLDEIGSVGFGRHKEE